MRAIAAALLLALCVSPSVAANDGELDGRSVAGPVAAKVVKVRDGDTVEVEALIWPNQTVRTAVRLRGVDAPELRGRCEAEQEAAEAARDRLTALLASGSVELREVSGDKYFGRVLARLSTSNVPDISATLLREGLVVPYGGNKRRDWCGNAAASVSSEGPGRSPG